MTESIQKVKARLRKKYLGRQGIHAFGIDANAIVVYFEPRNTTTQERLIAALRRDSGNFEVQAKAATAARATHSTPALAGLGVAK